VSIGLAKVVLVESIRAVVVAASQTAEICAAIKDLVETVKSLDAEASCVPSLAERDPHSTTIAS